MPGILDFLNSPFATGFAQQLGASSYDPFANPLLEGIWGGLGFQAQEQERMRQLALEEEARRRQIEAHNMALAAQEEQILASEQRRERALAEGRASQFAADRQANAERLTAKAQEAFRRALEAGDMNAALGALGAFDPGSAAGMLLEQSKPPDPLDLLRQQEAELRIKGLERDLSRPDPLSVDPLMKANLEAYESFLGRPLEPGESMQERIQAARQILTGGLEEQGGAGSGSPVEDPRAGAVPALVAALSKEVNLPEDVLLQQLRTASIATGRPASELLAEQLAELRGKKEDKDPFELTSGDQLLLWLSNLGTGPSTRKYSSPGNY